MSAPPFTRARWRELLEQLRGAARQVVAGGRVDARLEVEIQIALKGAAAAGTALGFAGAAEARRILLTTAHGFLMAPVDARAPFAPVLTAAAELVDGYLAAEATADAERTWKRHLAEE